MILPIGREQQRAALEIINAFGADRHEETARFCVFIKGARVYVDTALCDDPEAVHFKVAIATEPTHDTAQFVFDVATAGQLIMGISEIDDLFVVPTTPTDRLHGEWRAAQLCESPQQLHRLLVAGFQAHAANLERLRAQWR